MFENAVLLVLSLGMYSAVLGIGYPLFAKFYAKYKKHQQCESRRTNAKQYLNDFVKNEYKY